jgi:hypothetical protein
MGSSLCAGDSPAACIFFFRDLAIFIWRSFSSVLMGFPGMKECTSRSLTGVEEEQT